MYQRSCSLKRKHYTMWFENHFLFFFWHFRTRALSKGLSFVLKYWDLASTFYSVQQQKTLNLSWLCCEWVDAVKLLMLQEIHWVIYSAFVVLRLWSLQFFLWGFCQIVHRQYLFITIHGKPLFIILSIALRNSVICCYHTYISHVFVTSLTQD